MNKWVIGIVIAVVAVLAVPVLIVLALLPVRVETEVEGGAGIWVPSDLEALTVHDRLAIELTWTPVVQTSITYVLQRSTTGAEGPWDDVVELEQQAGRYLDQGLEDAVTYFYRIRAFDATGGSGQSNVTSAVATELPGPLE